MIGELLTGLCANERVAIELDADTAAVKTKFIIENAPAWVDLEVGRIAHMWERLGYKPSQAISYAWASLCLVEMHNVKEPGDVVRPPRTEQFTTCTRDKADRIPLEWIVKTWGKKYEIVDELSTAIYVHNHLTEGERKNWTWQGVSKMQGSRTPCPAPGQAPPATAGQESTANGAGGASCGSTQENSVAAASTTQGT